MARKTGKGESSKAQSEQAKSEAHQPTNPQHAGEPAGEPARESPAEGAAEPGAKAAPRTGETEPVPERPPEAAGEAPAEGARGGGPGWAAGAAAGAVVAVLVVVGAALLPPVRDFLAAQFAAAPAGPAPASAEALARLEARVAALEGTGVSAMPERMAAIERRLDEVGARAGAVAGLEARVDALAGLAGRVAKLEATVAALGEQAAAGRAPDPEVAALKSELAAAKSTLADATRRIAALEARPEPPKAAEQAALRAAFAVSALIGALDDGAPFKAFVAPSGPALAAAGEVGARARGRLHGLDPFAETGVPHQAVLLRRIDGFQRARSASSAAPGAEGASKEAGEGAKPGLWERALARMERLVTISRVGEPAAGKGAAAPGDAALLAAARQAIVAGDMKGAVAAIETMSRPPMESEARTAFETLRASIRARIEANELIADLRAVLVRLAAAPASGGGQ